MGSVGAGAVAAALVVAVVGAAGVAVGAAGGSAARLGCAEKQRVAKSRSGRRPNMAEHPSRAGNLETRQGFLGWARGVRCSEPRRLGYEAMFRHSLALIFTLVSVPLLLTVACVGGEGDDGTGGSSSSGGSGPGGADPGGAGPGSGGTEQAGCGEPSGDGTEVSGTIGEDTVWTPEGSPYIVTNDVSVDAELLLEACTVVRLDPGVRIFVNGSLVARGTAEEGEGGDLVLSPVAFVPNTDAPWGSIDVQPEGFLDLEVTGFIGGGSQEATIHAWGVDQYGLPHRNVRALGVSISGSQNYGVMLETRAGFTEDSTDLAIDSSGSEESPFPIYVEAGAVGALPDLLTFDINAVDEILVYPFRPVEEDTFKSLGYPYRVRGSVTVAREDGGVATLTIEPGVTLRMEDYAGSGFEIGNGVDNEGRLIAVGTEAEPIRFESALDEPAPGDWLGLYFSEPVTTGNRVEYVEIAHAGAFSGAQSYGCGPIENDASILILNPEPVAPFIENTTIESAGGDTQILLGWDYDGDPTGAAQVILDANTFDDAGPECRVSLPQDETSQCPGLDDQPDCL